MCNVKELADKIAKNRLELKERILYDLANKLSYGEFSQIEAKVSSSGLNQIVLRGRVIAQEKFTNEEYQLWYMWEVSL